VRSRLGLGLGLAICEDFWHLPVPQVLALDGAEILVNVSSSPGRDVRAGHELGLGTPAVWRPLMRTYAQLTTSIVVFCNRVGVDEGVTFFGGSEVIGPDGSALLSAPLWDEGLFTVDVDVRDVRRARLAAPLLREERLEWNVRELSRIVSDRAGIGEGSLPAGVDGSDGRTAASRDAEVAADVAPGRRRPVIPRGEARRR